MYFDNNLISLYLSSPQTPTISLSLGYSCASAIIGTRHFQFRYRTFQSKNDYCLCERTLGDNFFYY
jgi:hypothetical protein